MNEFILRFLTIYIVLYFVAIPIIYIIFILAYTAFWWAVDWFKGNFTKGKF